jgi:glycosyltransferase involved in cell wall biosynthesis
MKKVAMFYPLFMGGGAETVVLWMLQALQEKYDVTLFTLGNVDFRELNSMYATDISPKQVKVMKIVPDRINHLCHWLTANNDQARMILMHLVIRFYKKHAHNYDLGISGYNATDLGKKGIQYIHMTQVMEGSAWHRQLISSFSQKQLLDNVSITNSQHLADYAKKVYGFEADVVYPPVLLDAPEVPWQDKEYAFICSGRLVKPKEPHKVIEILKKVRDRGFKIKLYLTGGGGGVYGMSYQKMLQKLVQENADWITLCENLPYDDYTTILANCQYGIHYKKEPFGISVADMVKAGAIPFVRDIGGQTEIVGKHNQELLFDKVDEAVDQIVAVLSSPAKQAQLLQSLQAQKDLFSTAKFMHEFSQVVESYFQNQAA